MATTAAPEITTMAIEMSEVGLKAESVADIAASCGEKIIGEGMAPPLFKNQTGDAQCSPLRNACDR
jgi:hypothetical protein